MATTPTTPGFSNPQPTPTMPLPGDPGAQGQPGGQGLQGPASPIMELLSNWLRVSQEIGQHEPRVQAAMQKVAGQCREALTVLAREHTQGQQQGLPTDNAAGPKTAPGQAQANSAGYPPSGY